LYKRRWVALGFLAFSLLVIALDNTVLNLALPSISRDLGATLNGLQWIVDAYTLVFAALLLTMGSIGDRFGRKKILQGGLIVFGLFSLGAALSKSTGSLVTMRALMGIGGATIMPCTLSILTATFRDAKERAQAIAVWAATFSLGMGIGPLVGGWLLAHFHWSSVFYINLPVVVIALIGGYFFIQDSRAEHPRRIDVPGCILSLTGFFALVYGIIQAGISSWTTHNVLYAFTAAVVLLIAFIVWELHTTHAMLPLRFFKNMSFTGANVALTLITFSMFGCFFFLSQYLQSVHSYSPPGRRSFITDGICGICWSAILGMDCAENRHEDHRSTGHSYRSRRLILFLPYSRNRYKIFEYCYWHDHYCARYGYHYEPGDKLHHGVHSGR
jgi:EmrB/QacA subfamily drug resistance transporter